MPIKQIVSNTAHIAANTEILQHLTDAGKIIGPFIGVILALVIWAWRKMERTQDKIEIAFVTFVKENDTVHDKIFTDLRESDAKLNTLLGAHEVNHK